MRDCKVTLRGNTAEVSKVNEYINEHDATRLVITLSDELNADGISYHTICFKPGAALKNPPNIKVTTDMLTAENGTLTYPLPQALTGFGALDAQVQAHIADEKGELVGLIKSPVFRLDFEPSITGDEDIILGDAEGFIAEIHKALKELNLTIEAADELCNRISEAFENGELNGEKGEQGDKGDKGDKGEKGDKGDNALINGYNAITLQSGNNLKLKQNGEVITLDVNSIPTYLTFPETAEYGDVCLYPIANVLTAEDSGKDIVFDWQGFCNSQNDSSTFETTFYKNGTELGYINAGYTFSDDMTYVENMLNIVLNGEERQICFVNGIFEPEYSWVKKNGGIMQLAQPPASYTLPEYDEVVCNYENITDTVFYARLMLMYYHGEWRKLCTSNGNSGETEKNCIPVVHELPTEAADGDMCLYSPANIIEPSDSGKRIYFDWEEFTKPVSEYSKVMYTFRLPYGQGSSSINYQASTNANNLTIQKNTYNPTTQVLLKVTFDNGTLSQGLLKTTVEGVEETIEFASVDELPKYFDLFEFNKILRKEITGTAIAFYTPYRFMVYRAGEWQRVETSLDIPTGIDSYIPADKIELTTETATLEPNTHYSFGEVATLTLEFAEGDAAKVNEYMFSFTSGETATVLTLPSSVQWANELTVEANKRYEISVVDNIGLWCTIDLAVSE